MFWCTECITELCHLPKIHSTNITISIGIQASSNTCLVYISYSKDPSNQFSRQWINSTLYLIQYLPVTSNICLFCYYFPPILLKIFLFLPKFLFLDPAAPELNFITNRFYLNFSHEYQYVVFRYAIPDFHLFL